MTENLPPDQPDAPRDDPTAEARRMGGDDPSAAETRRMTSGDPLGGPERPAGDPPPPPPPPPAARRLTRSRDDRVISGVAGGLGAYLGVDAVLVRLAFIVLAFFGGAGVLGYLAAIFLVPDAPAGAVTTPRPGAAPDRNRTLKVVGLVLLVLVAGPLLFVPAAVIGGLAVPLATLAILGLLTAWLVTGRRPGREPGQLVKAMLLGLGVLVLLFVLAGVAFWTAGLGGDAVVAGFVIAAGVALLVGAVARPVRWLILPALAVALPAGFVGAAGIELDGGVGERSYRPGTAAQVAQKYELGAGELTLDLRDADLPAGERRLALEVGLGEATLIVPEDVCVATDARVGMGVVELFDRDHGGVDVDVDERPGVAAGTTRLVVDADVGLGALEVRHTDQPDEWQTRWDRRDEDDVDERDFGFGDDDPPGNRACAGA